MSFLLLRNKVPQTSQLKITYTSYLGFHGSGSRHGLAGSLLRSHQAEIVEVAR